MATHPTSASHPPSSRRSRSARDLFLRVMDDCLEQSVIAFELPSGETVRCGAARESRRENVVVTISDDRFFKKVLTHGNLGLGQSFMKGYFTASPSLADFLLVLLKSRVENSIRRNPLHVIRLGALRVGAALRRKEDNIHVHYDSGIELFEKFLDPNYLVYSCGYAKTAVSSLDDLQADKLDRVCRKLHLRQGERLLDIGCGYGGMLIYAAQHYGVNGLGITNSREMHANALKRIREHGLEAKITVEYRDFCELAETGDFDKVVSIGMMEHVKRSEYDVYWRKIAGSLKTGGRALVHTIACATTVNEHDPFIQKYIFPGSNQPRLSEIATSLERNGLYLLDIENIVRHYSYTLTHWLRRFEQHRDQLGLAEEVQRMWIYYFNCGIVASLAAESMVLQVLFTNDSTIEMPLQRV